MRIVSFAVFAALALTLTPAGAWAGYYGERKQVDGLIIQSGMVPSGLLQRHDGESPEGSMHGGVPASPKHHHFMVALFEKDTGERIGNAKVTATVGEVGMGGTTKELEPMQIRDTTTFGNYFEMGEKGPYRVRLTIRRPGEDEVKTTLSFPGISGHQ